MEKEFNKEIPVGFIHYMRVGSRKPVLINTFKGKVHRCF